MNKLAFGSAIFVTLALLLPGSEAAEAHASLQHASPPAGAELDHQPTLVEIEYSTEIDLSKAELNLADETGNEVPLLAPSGEARVGTTFSRAITQPLGSGTYKVRWRVLSKDGHWTRGDYYFSVKVAPN